jgi:hypothetical protein
MWRASCCSSSFLAGAEGVLGLLQVGPSGGGMLYFGNEEPGQYVAIGTFVNRNHLPRCSRWRCRHHRPHRLQHARRPPQRAPQRACAFVGSDGQASALVRHGRDRASFACCSPRSRAGIATGVAGLACAGVVLVRAAAARAHPSRLRTANLIAAALIVNFREASHSQSASVRSCAARAAGAAIER